MLKRYKSQLVADFQQYYNLRLNDELEDYPETVPDLIFGLPPFARVFVAQNPELAWNTDTYLLRSMEHTLRILAWQKTKDGQSKNPKHLPKPVEALWEADARKITDGSKYLTNRDVGDLKEFVNRPSKKSGHTVVITDKTTPSDMRID